MSWTLDTLPPTHTLPRHLPRTPPQVPSITVLQQITSPLYQVFRYQAFPRTPSLYFPFISFPILSSYKYSSYFSFLPLLLSFFSLFSSSSSQKLYIFFPYSFSLFILSKVFPHFASTDIVRTTSRSVKVTNCLRICTILIL